MQQIAAFDHRGRGAAITAPTLIVAGADDLPLPLLHARRLLASIPGSRLVVVPRVGHYVPLFRAEELCERLTAHLARVPRAGTPRHPARAVRAGRSAG